VSSPHAGGSDTGDLGSRVVGAGAERIEGSPTRTHDTALSLTPTGRGYCFGITVGTGEDRMDQLLRWGRDAGLLALAASLPALAFGAGAFIWRRRSMPAAQAARRTLVDVLLVVTVIAVLVVGLRPGMGEVPDWQQWTLVPFQDLLRSLDGSGLGLQLAVANLLGNVLLYVPVGLALRLRFPRIAPRRAMLIVILLSLFVEVGQAIEATGRTSDITDVIANGVGGWIGWLAGGAILRAAAAPIRGEE